MEFQLAYYALRRTEYKDRGKLRNATKMLSPLRGNEDEEPEAFFYEAQISFLLLGIDEWFWTAYCCTDTFLNPNLSIQWNQERGIDGPSALVFKDQPFWNAREYFLLVLSRRLAQAAMEWRNLINVFESRLAIDVRNYIPTSLNMRVDKLCCRRMITIIESIIKIKKSSLIRVSKEPDSTQRLYRSSVASITCWKEQLMHGKSSLHPTFPFWYSAVPRLIIDGMNFGLQHETALLKCENSKEDWPRKFHLSIV